MNVKWGFIGAGFVATKAVAPAVHRASNATLAAVASQDRKRAQALAPQKIYERYEDLLADPHIDAVYINLANHQHCQWTVAALSAGKHVLCEKPLALNYSQSKMMADAATQYNRVIVEALWNQWHPRFVRIVELVKGGDIGALKAIDSSFCFPAQIDKNYRLEPTMGGGSLLDVGVYQTHLWSALNHGEPEFIIDSVTQNIGLTGVDLTTKIDGQLANGVKIRALTSFEKPESQELLISGELATIECLGGDAFTSWKKPSLLRIGENIEEFAPVDPYGFMIENFSNFISDEPAQIPTIEQSLYVAKLLDQIRDFNK
ncbi:oxidoreductase [Actinomycetes bacterium]|nr:oxidoreductase [Actinomycetes bacterium]